MTKKAKIEKAENNLVKIEMTIDAKVAQDTYNKVLKKFGANLNIAGFRKGKAPNNVVEKYVGVQRLQIETIETLFPNEFSKVAEENKFDMAIQPQIEDFDFELGKDLTLKVNIELKPEVNLAPYKNVEVKYEEFKNEKDALDKELEMLQTRLATLETVEEAATDKDTVVFDFEGSVDGVVFPGGTAKGHTLDLANSNFIPGFAEGLVGHKKGEEFVIDVPFPENYHEPTLKGKMSQFKINMIEVKKKVLPELNDELAKKAGNFENLEALKTDIQKYLDETQTVENEKRKSDAIFNSVYDNTKIDIQESMINREVEAIKEETKQNAVRQGQNWDAIVESEGGIEAITEKIKEEAVKRIKNTLIIEKITKEEKITVEQNDLMGQIQELARMYGSNTTAIFEEMKKNPNSFSVLHQQVTTKKINDLLLSSNNFKTK